MLFVNMLIYTVGLFWFNRLPVMPTCVVKLPITYFVLLDRYRVLPMQLQDPQCHFQQHIQQLYHHLLLPWRAQCVILTHGAC